MINNKIYIIAEIGVNHNGSLRLAKELIRECKKSGADAVKFQTYSSDSICATDTNKAPYQMKRQGEQSQLNMLRKYELKYSDFIKLKKYSESKEIDFITTIADKEDIHFITRELKVKSIKVGSSDLTNIQLLLHLGRTNKKILLSTGMSDFNDINIVIFKSLLWMKRISIMLSCLSLFVNSGFFLNFWNELKFRTSRLIIFIIFSLFFGIATYYFQ